MTGLLQRIIERWQRFGRCDVCNRWRWNLEDGEVVTDCPEAHSWVMVRQCQDCWNGDTP